MKTIVTVDGVTHEYPKGYDSWNQLWKADPEEFDRQRLEVLELQCRYIAFGDEDRAQYGRQIVWRMEQRLNKYKDTTARLNELARMMWASTTDMVYATKTGEDPRERGKEATVIEFDEKRKQKTDS